MLRAKQTAHHHEQSVQHLTSAAQTTQRNPDRVEIPSIARNRAGGNQSASNQVNTNVRDEQEANSKAIRSTSLLPFT